MGHSVSVIINKPGEKTFVFDGDFTIQTIETTKDDIQNNLKDASLLILDLNGLNIIDISFLQLLYSVVLYCEKNKISVQFSANSISEDCKTIINKSGFEKIIK